MLAKLARIILLLSLLLAVGASADLFETASMSCPVEGAHPIRGTQLMQTRHVRPAVRGFLLCSTEIGKRMPLNDEGFQAVANSCCYDDMKDFIRRAAGDLKLQVCDEGGLSGFAPFFSCPSKPTTFTDLQSSLEHATAVSGEKCHWLGAVGDLCTPPDPSCGISSNPTGRPTLLKGYFGLLAGSNPSLLITTPAVTDAIQSLFAQTLGFPVDSVTVTVGTGPIGKMSFLRVFSCTVFVSYAVAQTDPPMLDASSVVTSIAAMKPVQFQNDISAAIVDIAPGAGTVEISTFRYCQEGGTCADKSIR